VLALAATLSVALLFRGDVEASEAAAPPESAIVMAALPWWSDAEPVVAATDPIERAEPFRVDPSVEHGGIAIREAVELAANDTEAEFWTGCTIRGTVVDDEGRPVAGAHVVSHANGGLEADHLTDPAGSFVISEVSPGRYDLIAEREGYVPTLTLASHVRVVTGLAEATVRVELIPLVRATGWVEDAEGRPAGGAELRVESRGALETPTRRLGYEFDLGTTHAAKDGTFEMLVPSRGEFRILASATNGSVRMMVSDPSSPIRVRLDAEGRGGPAFAGSIGGSGTPQRPSLSIEVRGCDGAVIQTPLVHLVSANGTAFSTSQRAGDGRITANPWPGRYTLFATAHGYGSARVEIDVGKSEPDSLVRVVLPRSGFVVANAIDDGGQPLVYVYVAIVDAVGYAQRKRTDSAGSVRFRHVAPGQARVFLLAGAGEALTCPAPEALRGTPGIATTVFVGTGGPTEVRLALPDSGLGRLVGIVRGTPNRIAALDLELAPRGAWLFVDGEGTSARLESSLIAPGRHRIEIELDDEAAGSLDVEIEPGKTTDVAFTIETGSVRGRVIGAGATVDALSGSAVLLRASPGTGDVFDARDANGRSLSATMVDHVGVASRRILADGTFEFEAIAPGPYLLRIDPDDGDLGVWWRRVEVTTAGCDVGVVELTRATTLLLSDPNRAPADPPLEGSFETIVVARDGMRFVVRGRPGSAEIPSICGFPWGEYRVELHGIGEDRDAVRAEFTSFAR
jgi:hypothetical protein